VSCESLPASDEYFATASVDLLGEITGDERPKFQRGVTTYPSIGDTVDLITNQELRTVYAPSGSDQINIGTLQQDKSVIAYVDVEEMFEALRDPGFDRRRQIDQRLAAAERNSQGAAEPAHLPARRP